MKGIKVALTGGGTGGHIYPCLALAEELLEQNPDSKIFYIGNHNKLEARLLEGTELKDHNENPYSSYIKFLSIEAEALPRSLNPFKYLSWVMKFSKNISEAKKHLKENQIDIVFGTGGYVSGPTFVAAIALNIPYIIHNLDAHMGLANKVFVKDAAALTLAFDCIKEKPKNGNVQITGNPISKKFTSGLENNKPDAISKKLHLLITGGSQGAESINNAIGEMLNELVELNIEIIHVTGKKTHDKFIQKYLGGNKNLYPNYKVLEYTHEMPQLCSWADIAVCRSGAMTIAEMTAANVVSIFVPLPWAAHDHQNKNAAAMVDAGAAMCLDQDDKSFQTKLFYIIQGFTNEPSRTDVFLGELEKFKTNASKNLLEIIQKILA